MIVTCETCKTYTGNLTCPYWTKLTGRLQMTATKACSSWEGKNVEPEKKATVFERAEALVNGPRRQAYGPVTPSCEHIAQLWSAYLKTPITARQACWMMVLFKAVRDHFSPKQDNIDDGCGYIRLIDMMEAEKNG